MNISLDDAWYLLVAKISIILLALGILLRLIKLSLWNCSERYGVLCANYKTEKYFAAAKDLTAYLVNVGFIWLVLQGMLLLVFSIFGFSPQQLLKWHFHETTFVAVIILLLISSVKSRLIEKLRN
jgi:hypothetical protein